jgi:hypothetical protein
MNLDQMQSEAKFCHNPFLFNEIKNAYFSGNQSSVCVGEKTYVIKILKA